MLILYYLLFPMILPEFLNLSFFYYWQTKHWDWDVKQKTCPNWISQTKRGGERQMGKLPTAHKFCQVFAFPIPDAIKHWKTRAGNNFSWCAPINGIHSFHDNVNGHASIGGVKTQSAVDRVIMSWHFFPCLDGTDRHRKKKFVLSLVRQIINKTFSHNLSADIRAASAPGRSVRAFT